MNQPIKQLDTFNYKLQDISLVEASAGTGKTYAIVNLFLKAILNCGEHKLNQAIDHKEILLVTFTNAAVSELKERIKLKIKDLHNQASFLLFEYLEHPDPLSKFQQSINQQQDPFFKQLFTEYAKAENPLFYLQQLVEKISLVIQEIDKLAIYTIDKFIAQCLDQLNLTNPHINLGVIDDEKSDKLLQICLSDELTQLQESLTPSTANASKLNFLVNGCPYWNLGYDSIYFNPPKKAISTYYRYKSHQLYWEGSSSSPTELVFECDYFNRLIGDQNFVNQQLPQLKSLLDLPDNQFDLLLSNYQINYPLDKTLSHSLSKLAEQRKSHFKKNITPYSIGQDLLNLLQQQLLLIQQQAATQNNPLLQEILQLQKLHGVLQIFLQQLIQHLSQINQQTIELKTIAKVINNRCNKFTINELTNDVAQIELSQYKEQLLLILQQQLAEISHFCYSSSNFIKVNDQDQLDHEQSPNLNHLSFIQSKWLEDSKQQVISRLITYFDQSKNNSNNQLQNFIANLLAICQHSIDAFVVLDRKLFPLIARQEYLLFVAHLRNKVNKQLDNYGLTSFNRLATDFETLLYKNKLAAEQIRQLYPLLIIDEFQDTSIQQYSIFSKLYLQQPNKTIGMLMIGDPKQSIYAFRGSDLNSYFKAKEQAHSIYSLASNYRSNQAFINGLNNVFTIPNSFYSPQLSYQHLQWGGKEQGTITYQGHDLDPIAYWQLDQQPYSQAFFNNNPKTAKPVYLASLIAWMIKEGEQGNLLIDGKKLQAADIAVLAVKGTELQEIKDQLDDLAVNSNINTSKGNNYSQEVLDSLKSLIVAVKDYSNYQAIGDYALSILSFMSIEQVMQLKSHNDQPSTSLIELQKDLANYQRIWKKQGFSAFVSYYMQHSKMVSKASQKIGGEKIVADFMALTDWIEKKMEIFATPEQIINFILKQKEIKLDVGQDYQTRISSLEKVVTLTTFHSSKGLEYPVVFVLNYHVPQRIKFSSLDKIVFNPKNFDVDPQLGHFISNLDEQRIVQQTLQENIRLYYVALSRAKYACYIATSQEFFTNEDLQHSNLNHLSQQQNHPCFSFTTRAPIEDPKINLLAQYNKYLEISNCFEEIPTTDSSLKIINQTKLYQQLAVTKKKKSPQFIKLTAQRKLNNNLQIGRQHSFSSLLSFTQHQHSFQIQEDDRSQDNLDLENQITINFPESTVKDLITSHNLGSGTNLGILVHEILEKVNFNKGFVYREKNVRYFANTNGILQEDKIQQLILWLDQVIKTKLDINIEPPLSDKIGSTETTLQNLIYPENHCNEWRFKFKVKASAKMFNGIRLRNLLNKYQWANIFNAHEYELYNDFSSFFGYLVGVIDLLFIDANNRYWIIDYKTNNLGNYYQDYTQQNIKHSFIEHRYDLQLLLYTVALHIYLRKNIHNYNYQHHIAGGLYLYLRGMGRPEITNSYFYLKPPQGLVEDLAQLLTDI